MTVRRIGVLTGGGDAPGLNPAIKALVYRAAELGISVTGLHDGWDGLLDSADEVWPLDEPTVRTWDRDGGTHLGSSRTNPFNSKLPGHTRHVDRSAELLANVDKLGLEAVVALGGEDTLGAAARLGGMGLKVVGIPKTIDKDLGGTDYTLGFDTSLRVCAEIIERSRTPAGSHHWVQVVEVMGRHAGHLALWSGVAGGAQMILIPEHSFEMERVLRLLEERLTLGRRDRRQPRYAIVVISEGAVPVGGHEMTLDKKVDAFGHARLGGIGDWLANQIRLHGHFEARAVSLGHPQRGGPPSPVDRIMGMLYGTAAAEAVARGAFGQMVSARGVAPACDISLVPLEEAVRSLQLVDVKRYYDTERYFAARRVL
ncbi:MAG TPA: ATP-dependent 6-phosphofructokinase [Polyangia bacterium]|jgi:6-phosphofructokinase 1|nr:ATP-dependent 6-phosphofructokinase [Polyangia bacterium]